MMIDFLKLLQLLTPQPIREAKYALHYAVSNVFVSLYTAWKAWQRDMQLQAVTTCQVMYLETMLNYRLLGEFTRSIYITDGDVVTADFVINVPVGTNVDYKRLYALVDKYRLYGKRFTVGQDAYTYQFEWTGMVCEINTQTYQFEWTGMVCETNPQTFSFEWTGMVCEKVWDKWECSISVYTDEEHSGQHLVLASTRVTTNIQVLVVYCFGGPADANETTAWHTILMNDDSSGWKVNPDDPSGNHANIYDMRVVEVNPTSDEFTDYYPFVGSSI